MLWLLLPFLLQVSAKTVLIECAECSNIEYKAMLKAHPALTSPVEEYIESHPAPANRERLLALFTEAQKDFLSASNAEAATRFEDIVKMIVLDDWERSDREIFLHAFLRLAQMEPSAEKRDRWLGRSLAMVDVKPAADLFPPPLLARRMEIEKQIPHRDLAKRLLARGWDEILIDGHPCVKDGCEAWSLYPGEVRVTALSNRWAPQTKLVDSADLEKRFAPATEAWASGTCTSTEMSSAAKDFSDAQVFWGLKCHKTPNVAVNPRPVTPAEPLPLFTSAEPTQSRSIFKSPWLWGGVAAVVVAAVVIANSKTHESTQTTTSYGY